MVDVPPVLQIPQQKTKRFEDIKACFVAKYGHQPGFFARAPGRVNLIGEHIDYCGYAVLPMAIEQDILAAVSTNDTTKILIANTNSKYSDFECDINDFTINNSDPQWYNYFLCGLKGMLEHMKLDKVKGLTCMVDGTVPPSAGLSSSSALVCCSALLTMHANGQSLSKKELSDLCANCERYIGTQGGGMDQAISFMAQEGTAKLIEFNPLRSTDILLPEGAVFVIANSCVELNKAATSHFNIRVVECRLAAQIIAKAKGLKWQGLTRLGDVQTQLGITLEDAVSVVQEVLHKEPYSKEEVLGILGVTAEELAKSSLSTNTLTVERFKLYDRATHVFSEANRVLQFKLVCDNPPTEVMERLGQLMNESHASCRDMYECSCPDLDNLVEICVKSGAIGSRLTGAGWGGCCVSMVPANEVVPFLVKVRDRYYSKFSDGNVHVDTALFATQPGGGAAIYMS